MDVLYASARIGGEAASLLPVGVALVGVTHEGNYFSESEGTLYFNGAIPVHEDVLGMATWPSFNDSGYVVGLSENIKLTYQSPDGQVLEQDQFYEPTGYPDRLNNAGRPEGIDGFGNYWKLSKPLDPGTPTVFLHDLQTDIFSDSDLVTQQIFDINDFGCVVAEVERLDPETEEVHKTIEIPLPVKFKKLWETKNKANQILVTARRDDPKDNTQTSDSDGNLYGTPRYVLYVTADPSDSKYHISVDCELGGLRHHFVCAAYSGGSKINGTDKAFPAASSQPADMLIPASGTSQSGEDFVIKIAFDANQNGFIDSNEPPIDLTVAKSEAGSPTPPMIRGFSAAAVDAAKEIIQGQATGSGFTGWKPNFLGEWFVPNAQALERLFYDGGIDGIAEDYQPTSSLSPASLNAFGTPGDFNEWLTHHAGSNFNETGVTTVQHYYWDVSTRISSLIANSSPLSLLKSNGTITSQMTSVTNTTVEDFKQSSVAVGQSQTFPAEPSGYDLQVILAGLGAPHSSPSWVPEQTILVGDQDGTAGVIPDDAFGTVGRSRFINGEYRFIVKKEARVEHFSTGDPGGYDIPYTAVVVYLRISGRSQDLYDFNHNAGGLSVPAAITQLSYGNGGYERTNGIIYRTSVDILKDYEMVEIRLP